MTLDTAEEGKNYALIAEPKANVGNRKASTSEKVVSSISKTLEASNSAKYLNKVNLPSFDDLKKQLRSFNLMNEAEIEATLGEK